MLHARLEGQIAYLLSYLYEKQALVQIWGGGQTCKRSCGYALLPQMQGAPSQWLPLTNCEIAGLVGSNPQTVSPIIAKFCKQGLVVRHRDGLEVLNPKGLQELAQAITVANLL